MPAVEIWQDSKLVSRTDDRSLADAQAERLALLAQRRWEVETGGTVLGGLALATDDRSKTLIEGARAAAESDVNYSVRWKVGPGQFATLTAAQVIAAADAVRAHVQAAFDREATVAALILAATTNEAVDGIDYTTGWPS